MRFLLRKGVTFLATLVLISIITFAALHILPGDPALLVLGTEGDPQVLATLRNQLGLNSPLPVRYWDWVTKAVSGDLGESIRYSQGVAPLIGRGLPVTLSLALFGVITAILIGIPLGISCAVREGRLWDNFGLVFSQLGMALPSFWMGIFLINLLAVKLRVFPASGYIPWDEGASAWVISLTLPSLAVALPRAAILTRMVRTSILQVLSTDYIRTARSKGLSQRRVLYKHGLRNAGVTIFTVAGIQLTQLLAGTIVIEQVFGLPGLGQLLLTAVMQRDLPLVQGLVVVGATMILLANLFFDLILALLDPRVRFG